MLFSGDAEPVDLESHDSNATKCNTVPRLCTCGLCLPQHSAVARVIKLFPEHNTYISHVKAIHQHLLRRLNTEIKHQNLISKSCSRLLWLSSISVCSSTWACDGSRAAVVASTRLHSSVKVNAREPLGRRADFCPSPTHWSPHLTSSSTCDVTGNHHLASSRVSVFNHFLFWSFLPPFKNTS